MAIDWSKMHVQALPLRHYTGLAVNDDTIFLISTAYVIETRNARLVTPRGFVKTKRAGAKGSIILMIAVHEGLLYFASLA